MNRLAEEGFLLLAGPLAGTEAGRVRVLLICEADSEQEIHRRLADDPWAVTDQLVVVSVEPWKLTEGRPPTVSTGDRADTLASVILATSLRWRRERSCANMCS
jgi:uncharacterized protein YciI